MAKGQMRSGREAKKPKKSALLKGKPAPAPSPFQAPGQGKKPQGNPR